MNSIMSFEDRGRSFESKFALDQEIAFKIQTKTHTLVAEWAAERMGLDSGMASTYVENFRNLGVESGSSAAFRQKLLADFASNHIDISENALERLIALKSQIATKQVLSETAA